MRRTEPLKRLATVAAQLEAEGQVELAREVTAALDELRHQASPPGDLLTTGEAASLLGIRSLNTIKRWAAEGLLEGYRRGGRVLVTRASVERLLHSPTLAEQRAWEQRVDQALAPFDLGAEPHPPTGAAHIGRKPWTKVGISHG